jgi:hypothetical protein
MMRGRLDKWFGTRVWFAINMSLTLRYRSFISFLTLTSHIGGAA